MPKESTHFHLASAAEAFIRQSANPGFSEIRKIISSAPNLYMAGAAASDSIFNYLRGDARTFFGRYLKYSHDCSNHKLFGFFEGFAERNLPLIPALSFGAGAVCHLAADMIFHPLVFHFTGKDRPGEQEALIRHFSFESGMDKMLRRIFPELKKMHLRTYFNRKEMSDGDFAAALEAIHIPPDRWGEVPGFEFLSMFRQHCRHESYYGRRLFHRLSGLISVLPGGTAALPALMYSDSPDPAGSEEKKLFLEKPIEYRNPVSGAGFRKSFSDLQRDFTVLLTEFLLPVEQALRSAGGPPEAEWGNIIPAVNSLFPKNPESGLPCIEGDGGSHMQMSFFRLKTFGEVWL